jgi:hypothetical protein
MRLSFEGLASASTSTQLPAGPYAFEIDLVNGEYESPNTGSKALEIKCHIVDGVDFDDGSSTVGLQRTLRFWHPAGDQKDGGKFCLGRINEFVLACGLDTGDDGFDDEDLVGRKFKARCRIKKDKKTDRDNEEFDKFGAY